MVTARVTLYLIPLLSISRAVGPSAYPSTGSRPADVKPCTVGQRVGSQAIPTVPVDVHKITAIKKTGAFSYKVATLVSEVETATNTWRAKATGGKDTSGTHLDEVIQMAGSTSDRRNIGSFLVTGIRRQAFRLCV